jgi:hypothetical protein
MIRLLDQLCTALSILFWYSHVASDSFDTHVKTSPRVLFRIERLSDQMTLLTQVRMI